MGHITPNDVVPALRSNLVFSRPPLGLGTGFVRVKNFTSGEEFRMRGFEYSLARMLDGRRTAAQVVEAAGQVGLPVTMEDLEGFVKKLEEQHLVTPVPAVPEQDELSPFEHREPWGESTRKLFRLALREGRQGNLNRALVSLDCLLHEQPGVEEALRLRERLEQRIQAPESVAAFKTVFEETELDWRATTPPERAPMSRRKAGMIAGGIFFALGVLALSLSLIPFPHHVTQEATLFPIASAKVTAPRTGKIAAVPVAIGQWVEKGAVLYSYDVTVPLQQLEAAVERLGTLNRDQHAYLPQTKEVKEARTRYVKAEAWLATAQAALEMERINDGDWLIDAEDELNWALLEITAAREALDALVPEPQRVAVREARAEVQELELQLLESEVTAPLSGSLTLLGVQPGAEVVKGLGVAQIDDTSKLKGVALVEPRDRQGLKAGQPVLLLSNGRATNTAISSTSGRTVEVIVDNDARTFEPGAAEFQIRGQPVPIIR